MKKGTILWSIGFQVFLYFVLVISVLMTIFCSAKSLWLWDNKAYAQSYSTYVTSRLEWMVKQKYCYAWQDRKNYPQVDDVIKELKRASANCDETFQIIRERDNGRVWGNLKEDAESTEKFTYFFSRGTYYDPSLESEMTENYYVEVYVDMSFPKADEIGKGLMEDINLYAYKEVFLCGAIGGLLLCIISFIWLLCNAGHRPGREGIVPGVLTNIYLDVLTVLFGVVALGILFFFSVLDGFLGFDEEGLIIALTVMAETVCCTAYLREFALRLKLGKGWRYSAVFVICRTVFGVVGKLCRMTVRLYRSLPAVPVVTVSLLFVTLCEYAGICIWGRPHTPLLWIWFLEKVVLIPLVLYCTLAFNRLLKGSRAMAEGELSRKLDMEYLVYKFREQGENLNKINEGISKAVEQRMQSERLKTELITNVSHDLKTPLTSIINYADLLGSVAAGIDGAAGGEERAERIGQIHEYSEVLLRQSARLKKLLDDLVEASKANTGNLEVNLAPCELGVLLTQVAGEYEEKMTEKCLELHVAKPEEEIRILADGRHLWRVFDNLMNNICKYAQEHSRVYLNMEQRENRVEIIFRNMSKYELNVSPQELSERFVRGDASRHMEGSGLGLSIAKSLVELQKGEMEILTDGDLFKVILRFDVLKS